MSKSIVRASLYRHVHGVASKPEHEYTHIKAQATGDGTFITANEQLFAYAGALPGRIHVWPIANPGRLGADTPFIHVHKANVLDYEFNSIFHDELTHGGISSLLATGSDDCTVAITVIPNIGLKSNVTEAVTTLQGHERRINVVHWHPTASHLLATGSADQTLRVWDLLSQQEALSFSGFNDSVASFDWHCHGGQLVSTCKDTKVRIYDPRHSDSVQTFQGFNGAGISRMIWKGDSTQVIGVGNVKGGTRQMGIWDIKNTSKPLMVTDLDNAGGSLFPYYDPDNGILYVSGKGDGNIRYWEVTDEEPYVHFINSYSDTKSHAGVVFLPKKACDYGECEIAVALRMMGDKITKVSFRVPRKQTGVTIFHRDLYPETTSGLKPASLTASEWLGGENRPINKLQWNVAAGAREMHSILAAQAAATGKTITAAYASGALSPSSVTSTSTTPTSPSSNTLAPPVSEMGRSVPELEKMLAAAKIRINELKAEIFELEQKAEKKKALDAKQGGAADTTEAATAAEPNTSSTASETASNTTSPVTTPRDSSTSISELSTSMEPLPGESEAQTAARIKRLKAKAAADSAREKAAAKAGVDRAKKEADQKAQEEKQAAEKAAKQAQAEKDAAAKAAADKQAAEKKAADAAAAKIAAEKEAEQRAKAEKEATEQRLKQEKEKEEAEKKAKQEKDKEEAAKAAKEKEQADKEDAHKKQKEKAAKEQAEKDAAAANAKLEHEAKASLTTPRNDDDDRRASDSHSVQRLRFHSHQSHTDSPTSDDEEAERMKAEAVAKAEAVLRKEKEIAEIAQKKIAAAKAQAQAEADKKADESKSDSVPSRAAAPSGATSPTSATSAAAGLSVSPTAAAPASPSASPSAAASPSPTSSAASSTAASPKQKVKKSKKEKTEKAEKGDKGDKKKGDCIIC